MGEGRRIGNVNVLDLRRTTEEAVADIGGIGNVNMLVYSKETLGLIHRLSIGNVNLSIEIPAEPELRLVAGSCEIGRDGPREDARQAYLFVMGHVLVDSETPAEQVREHLDSLGGIAVMGCVFCPRSVAGSVQSKVSHIMGSLIAYPDDAKLIGGSLDLTTGFLATLEGPAKLVVTGSLRSIEVVPDRISEKIASLQVHGGIVCAEENVDALRSVLVSTRAGMTVIPAEHRFIEDELTLDEATLSGLRDAKLCCTGNVVIDQRTPPHLVDKSLSSLRSLGLILCPEPLREAMKGKLDLLEDRAIFYVGDLWQVRGEETLHPGRFEFTDGPITLLVSGELRIAEDVPPQLLAERLVAVHNRGEIRCSAEQMGAIEARLGLRDGEIRGLEPRDDSPYDVGNANMLAL